MLGTNGMNSQERGQMAAGIVVNNWTTTDAGNKYKIEEATPVAAAYSVVVLGTEEASAGVSFGGQNYGNGSSIETELKLTSADLTAATVLGKIAVVTISNKTIYVSYLDAATKFYTMQNGKGGYISLNSEYVEGGNLHLRNTLKPRDNKGLWWFESAGNGTYRIYNYSTGLSKVLGMKGSEASARATMVSKDDTSYGTVYAGTFNLGGGTANPSYIKVNGSNNWMNNRDNWLAFWGTASVAGDQGSKIFITEVNLADYPDVFYSEFGKVNKGTRPDWVSKWTLWYDVPASKTGVSDTWMEYALPVGNGQLGATFQGAVKMDNIQFNEKTLWAGNNTNSNQGYFQNFGSIEVTDMSGVFSEGNDESKPVQDYARYLDIMSGVGGVEYKSTDMLTQYSRRYFASATDKVLVAHYEAKGNDKLKLLVSFQPDGQIGAGAVTYTETGASFSGGMAIVSYNAAFEIVTDGQKRKAETGIEVSDATYMYIVMAAATDYDATKATCKSGETTAQLAEKVQGRISAAVAKGYETLLADHMAKHEELMGRVDLNLGGESTMTTENLIKFYNAQAQNKTSVDGLFLEALYFQYGRYFTIGANLDTSIHAPSNLQGIWNDRSNTSFWHCDVHADINVQMNYWPADPTNLSEMHLPFLNYIIDLASAPNSPWVALAQKIKSGAKGWTVAVENNIFGGTSTWCNGNIKTLGSWYCDHLWRYYKYTLDRDFLKKALPVMYQNALFTKSIATKNTDGQYVITGEWSPEHGEGNQITAFAQQTAYQGLKDLFEGYAELGSESPVTAAEMAELEDLYNNFDKGVWVENYNPGGVNWSEAKPCISEWKNLPLSDPDHRHLSHLMCLYPFNQVSAFATDADSVKQFQAAYNGMIARKGDVTGWSMGWQTNTYARCLDGDKAHYNLQRALRHSTSYVIAMGGQGGCYYNLFDAHSPFQIDGNYGCTSGVAEMLLQSYDDVITILPALPSSWKNGSVKGLKAQGNYTVDEEWSEGKATAVRITNNLDVDRQVSVRYDNKVATYDISANATLDIDLSAGLPTGVNKVVNVPVSTIKTIYDLSGRRVNKAEKGVYIINGQKVVF